MSSDALHQVNDVNENDSNLNLLSLPFPASWAGSPAPIRLADPLLNLCAASMQSLCSPPPSSSSFLSSRRSSSSIRHFKQPHAVCCVMVEEEGQITAVRRTRETEGVICEKISVCEKREKTLLRTSSDLLLLSAVCRVKYEQKLQS